MRYQGRLTEWNDERGFGFVTPNGGGDKAFVHISAFSNSRRRPVEGDLITYAVATDSKNRLRADDVRYPGERKPTSNASRPTPRYAAALTVPFGCVVVVLAFLGKIHVLVPFAYLVLSGITVMVYGFDKSAAMNNYRRTQESTLHLLSVLGGWPGALVAQQLFHHKSRKLEFRIVFWLTVVLNCGALGWFATGADTSFIRTMLGVADGSTFAQERTRDG